ADDLGDLLRVLGRDAVLERRDDAELLATGERLARVERLQRDTALDELGLQHVEYGLCALLGARFDEDGLTAPLRRGAGALEVVALLDLFARLVEGVLRLLLVHFRDDVKR